mmetsp:Transcript_11709/g.30521  ORF Transcript_11709/g.30521 Transcript_11709/m.30521 type:complete len:168 (-) Transcript_11709:82-585(-)
MATTPALGDLTPEVKQRAETAAKFFLTNGPSFEAMIREKKKDDPLFAWFFDSTSAGMQHYLRCITEGAASQNQLQHPPPLPPAATTCVAQAYSEHSTVWYASPDSVPAGVLASLVAQQRTKDARSTSTPLDGELLARYMQSLTRPPQPSAAVLAALSRYDAGDWPAK